MSGFYLLEPRRRTRGRLGRIWGWCVKRLGWIGRRIRPC